MDLDKLSKAELNQLSDRLYEQYGKALAKEHWGEFVLIYQDGRTVLAPTQLELVEHAGRMGPNGFVFKVGPRAVGRIGGHIRVANP